MCLHGDYIQSEEKVVAVTCLSSFTSARNQKFEFKSPRAFAKVGFSKNVVTHPSGRELVLVTKVNIDVFDHFVVLGLQEKGTSLFSVFDLVRSMTTHLSFG